MHKLQVRWQDGSETKHKFATIAQFKEFVKIVKFLGASMRFYSTAFKR